MRWICVLLCVSCFSLSSTRIAAASSCPMPVITPTSIVVGDGAYTVGAGDFNGDGKPDLAAVHPGWGTSDGYVSIHIGDGLGGFTPGATIASLGWEPYSVTVGELNGDGKVDLVVPIRGGFSIALLFGDGNGGFSAPQYTSGGADQNPLQVAIADFNNDGKADLAVGHEVPGSSRVAVLLGNGVGGFSVLANLNAGSMPIHVAAADFNRDGNQDLVAVDRNGSSVYVLMGNGIGGFAPPVGYFAGSAPQAVSVGDFNRDGFPDLVTANLNGASASVLLGNGNGTFAVRVSYAVGQGPNSAAVDDFNGDGNLDFLTTNNWSNNVTMYFGNGAGGFGGPTHLTLTGPMPAVSADFDSNGQGDVVFGNSGTNVATLLLHSCNDPGTTLPGSDVVVEPAVTLPNGDASTVSLRFDSVSAAGTTSVTASASGPPPPSGFKLTSPPIYYNITTTASFSGSVRVCLGWADGQIANENHVSLFHYEANQWVDITDAASRNTTTNTVCGNATTLSPFTLFETRYAFSGFLLPVDSPPIVNSVKAGLAVPIRFSLGGDHGLNVFAAGFPRVQQVQCATGATLDVIEETVTAGSSSLTYDAGTGRYNYVWKTDKAWGGSCRELQLRFNDGETYTARFSMPR